MSGLWILGKNLTNLTKRTNNETTSHAGIYYIPCKDCNKHYIGETQRNLEKRIYEHQRSIKANDDRNFLFFHLLELQHTFDLSQATLIKPTHSKTSRRLLESAVISKRNHIKQRPGFYQISPYLANIILNENKIKMENGSEFFFTLCHHTFENPFFFVFLIILPMNPFPPQLQPRHDNIDNFLRQHIRVNIFPGVRYAKTPFIQTPPYFFLSAP